MNESSQTYAVAPHGDRFLLLRPARENAGPPEVCMVPDWFETLPAIK